MSEQTGDKASQMECNPGIHCEVENCMYNDKNSNCYAKKINVGPTYAINQSDTACSTFKQSKQFSN